MKYFFSIAAVLSLVVADTGFVQLPLTVKKTNGTSSKASIKSQRKAIPDTLQNGVQQYFVDINLGTPGQKQTVSIDTGSSDLWVYGSNSKGAKTFYDPSQSSTSKYIDDSFSIGYVDGSGASGDYYTDESEMGGTKVNFQFAVSNKTASGDGVFGIAATSGEADKNGTYANYPAALKQQGLIESTAYSLYLDDVNATTGKLLFGGVDTGKYSGQLYTVPITDSSSFSVDFEVNGHKLNGILDAGTSITYLPDDIVSGLASQYGLKWQDSGPFQSGYYTDQKPNNASLTYSFSGANVTIPTSELFLKGDDNSYYFTVGPYSQAAQNILLGDTFLRSAYVVYDLDNKQIGIAQASYNGSGSVKVISSSGIPDAQPAPNS